MIMPQDRMILEILERLEIANSTLINIMTYNCYKTTARRLKKLVDDKVLYRTRDVNTKGYIYATKPFIKTPSQLKQIRHKNKRNELYLMLYNDSSVRIINAYREQLIDGVRADMVIEIEREGKLYNLIIEVETGCKKANINKYNDMFYCNTWARWFDSKPIVVWIMDQKVSALDIYYPYVRLEWDLENYNELWGK